MPHKKKATKKRKGGKAFPSWIPRMPMERPACSLGINPSCNADGSLRPYRGGFGFGESSVNNVASQVMRNIMMDMKNAWRNSF